MLAAIRSLLSSFFSLLSCVPRGDAESAGPWRLHMRDGYLRRNHDPPLKCSESSPQQTLLQYSCSSVVHVKMQVIEFAIIFFPRPYFLDSACLSLLASLCALPSSLLGPDPFLYHPALLGPNHLSSLFSLLFSLFSRYCSLLRSHFAPVTSNFESRHRIRFHRPGGMRETIKLVICYL